MQNSDFWTRITNLYGSQTSPVVLFMQNSVIRFRITSLYGSQPSSVVFGCKTARITGLYRSQTSPVVLCPQNGAISTCNTSLYGFQPSSVVFGCKTATFWSEEQVFMGPRLPVWICAYKIACLALELLVSMGPSPYLWFLDAKQRLLDQNNKSRCVPDLTYRFVHTKQRD